MQKVNIHEAKTTLSKLVSGVEVDGTPVELCRAGKPVARIVPVPPKSKKIIPGMLRGQIWVADDFDSFPPPEGALFGIKEGI